MGAQMAAALPHASAVVDEPAHLTAGYLALATGDFAVNREHPPLVKLLAALPLLRLAPALPAAPAMDRRGEDFEFAYSRAFLYEANDADRLLNAARLPIVALTMLLAAAAWLWGLRLLGNIPALAVLAWIAFEPNLLAHGRLVTTDAAAATFTLLFFASLERAMDGAHRRLFIGLAGSALGLALLSRYSCALLVPLAGVSLAIETRRTVRERIAILLAALGTGLLVLNAFYLAATGSLGGAPFPLAASAGAPMQSEPLVSMESDPVMRWAPIPVPRLWLEGLDLARWKNLHVEGPGYLNGEFSGKGWWSYFLLALGMKMTIPSIVASLLGIVLALRGLVSRDAASRTIVAWVLAPAMGLILLVTALTKAQIGLRYVLPAIPLLCLVAALPFTRIPDLGRWRLVAAVLATLALQWHTATSLRVHPYHLAYFNEAAGGPDRGHTHLVDSNLDWGQDLVGVKRFMEREGLDGINLYYFGTADPAYYGIVRWVPPRPGYYAVSATHLAGVYLPDRDYLAPFRGMTPVASIGHSILVYQLPQVPAFLTTPP